MFSVFEVSNQSLLLANIVNTNQLKIDFKDDAFGSGRIIINVASDGKTAQDTIQINVLPIDDAPTVLNGLNDVNSNEDDPTRSILLLSAFEDIDSELAFSVESGSNGNTNPSLLTTSISNDTLYLSFLADQSGTGTIVVTASSPNGKFVQTSFLTTVNPIDDPPSVINPLNDITNLLEDGDDRVLGLASVF